MSLLPSSPNLPSLSAQQTTELATFLLHHSSEQGIAAFEVVRDTWACVYLSPQARVFLGSTNDTDEPPYLGNLTTALESRSRAAKEPLLLSLPERCLEIQGGYSPGTDTSFVADRNAPKQFYVLLREAERSEIRLREERDRLERALAATGQAVWDWDLETGEAYVSPRWAQMLGRPVGNTDVDALYSPENWLDAVHPDDQNPVADAYAAFIVGDRAEYTIEFRIRHAGGDYRWIRSTASALRRDDNTAWRVTGAHTDITERKELESTREALLYQQSRIAETLQRVLLPLPGGTNYPGLETALLYEPASEEAKVGGDFCDAFPISGEEVALIVGDVMGKGLRAAVATAEIKFSLRTLLRQYRDPAIALRLLNRLMWESYKEERGQNPPLVPIAVVVANTRTHYIRAAVAGAEAPMILHRDPETGATNTQEVTCGGLMIGTLPEEDYERQIISMGTGDCLLMTTDGLTEVRDAWTDSFLGTKGVARLTHHALSSHRPLEEVKGAVLNSVRNYGGGQSALRDDVSMVLARWRSTNDS
ncbi:MAG: SpoIIE family protein phosphatase [Fibrella sp.]|nr:SpoIIE family protein phosphatase [Armatimonadota bacterium]